MYNRYSIEANVDSDHRHKIILEREGAQSNETTRSIEMEGEGYTLERNAPDSLFAPLRSMRLEVPLISESNFQFEHFIKESKKWRATLYINDTVYFKGVIENDLYEEEYKAPPYTVTLRAVCGLSRLQDKYIDLERIKTNERGLSSIKDIILHCLKMTDVELPVRFQSLRGLTLENYYLDPEMFRTSREFVRNTDKAGDVLEKLLRSFSLVCYQKAGEWIVERATARPSIEEAILLDSDEYKLYGSPSLSTEGAIGSTKINLASETFSSVFRMPLPTFPLPSIVHPRKFLGEYEATPRALCVSKTMRNEAPEVDEAAKGAIAVLYPSDSDERIAFLSPISVSEDIKEIDIEIELGFEGVGELENSVDIQTLAHIELGDEKETFYLANYDLAYRYHAEKDKIYKGAIANDETGDVMTIDFFGEMTYRANGWHKEEGHLIFSSPFSRFAHDWKNKHYDIVELTKIYNEKAISTLPWSRINSVKFKDSKLQKFSFKVARLWDSVKHYDQIGREKYRLKKKPQTTHLLVSIPSFVWRMKDKNQGEKITPSKILVGKIEVKYNYEEERNVEEFFVADLGTGFVREGEEIDLEVSTLIENITQPADLKGMLLNEKGEALKYLFSVFVKREDELSAVQRKDINIVEDVAQHYFSVYAHTRDVLQLELDLKTPLDIDRVYKMKTRKGHEYRIIGSIYRPFQEIEEVTLHELPQPLEETRYED